MKCYSSPGSFATIENLKRLARALFIEREKRFRAETQGRRDAREKMNLNLRMLVCRALHDADMLAVHF